MTKSKNLSIAVHSVTQVQRLHRFGHEGAVIWLTGLSASGKTTLAMGLEECLFSRGYACYTLDGDNVRHGLNADLGFSPGERAENVRRVGEVAALFADAGLICITAFISPYRQDRQLARQAARNTRFHEIHISADLAICEQRDPKGLYRKAREGSLHEFTGIDSPYEMPDCPELRIDTGNETPGQSLGQLVNYVLECHPLIR